MACATPGVSPLTARRATSSLAMWGKTLRKRSISSRPRMPAARTMAGTSWRGIAVTVRPAIARLLLITWAPVAVYDHGNNDSFGCAVTGGYVDRDPSSPSLNGVYFYGDYCSGKLLGLVQNSNNTWTSRLITDTPYNISSFGQDEQGGLYLADRGSGRIIQISQVSVITAPPFVSEGRLDGTLIESSENSGVGGAVRLLGPAFLGRRPGR